MPSKNDKDEDKKDEGKSIRKISRDEAAFILGAQGKTKTKLAHASGTVIELIELKGGQNQLEIMGDARARSTAMKYIDYVISQRTGPVKIDEASHPDDLTILAVPADTVSFITGTKGAYLRHVEDEWWTMLFFLQVDPKSPPVHVDPNRIEKLAIFGPQRQRRGAELKVMAAMENKRCGYFTRHAVPTESPNQGFGTDTMSISEDDYSYALGKNGNTRKKLARASNCIVEYIGRMAYFSGEKKERVRAKEYLTWLLLQRVGDHANVEYKGRDDVTMIMVQRSCIGYVTGAKGAALRAIEEETNTFCFIEGGNDDNDESQKPLLIFGRAEDRRFAESLVWERISTKLDEMPDPSKDSRKGKGRGKTDSKGGKKSAKSDGKGDTYGKGADYVPDAPRPTGKDIGSDFSPITDEDAAFIMGSSGKTKKKIAAVSGAFLELSKNRLEITGTVADRERAQQYVKIVLKQRLGPVNLKDIEAYKDLTTVEVPAEAVSFVTGKGGGFLRMVEEEWSTMLFFLDYNKTRYRDQPERLAIFGPERSRRGAELKVMAAIEMKQAGYYTNRDARSPMVDPQDAFATDRMPIAEEDYSYALGKGGSTRKKIARASNCIIEYIGRHAYLSGSRPERRRAREYLGWLFLQRVGPVEVDYRRREDVTILPVPKDCVGFVTGHKGTSLRAVEDTTGTFCFIEGGRDDPYRDPKPLLIFGNPDARKQAEVLLLERIQQKLEAGWVHEESNGGYGSSGGGYKGDRNRRPPREKGSGKGGFDSGGWPAASSNSQSSTAEPPKPVESAANPSQATFCTEEKALKEPEPIVEQEDDEAWGDWGGASGSEDGGDAAPVGRPEEAVNFVGGMSPCGRSPSGATGWSEQPVMGGFMAERLRGEQELQLPPQIEEPEAWPELGGPKSGKKGKKR